MSIGQQSKPPLGIAEDGPAIEVPSEVRYKYKIPIPIDSERRTVVFYPTSGNGTYSAGQTVKFNFAGNYADMANSYLAFDCHYTRAAGDSNTFMRSPHDCFRHVAVVETATGRTIENLTDYNVLYEMMGRHTAKAHYNPYEHAGGPGVAAAANSFAIPRNATTTLAGRFAIQPYTGLLRSKLYLPLKWMSGGLEVQLTLDTDANVVLAANADTVLVYSNFRWVIDMVSLDANFDTALGQWLSMAPTNQLNVPFETFTSHNADGNQPNPSITITQQVRSLKSFYAVRRANANIGVITTDAFDFPRAGGGQAINSFELRIGSQQHPAFTVPAGPVMYNELMKSLGHLMDSQNQNAVTDAATNPAALAEYEGHSYIIGVNLERHTHDEFFMMTGISTFTYSPILFVLHCNAAAATTITSFLHFDGIMGVNFTGQCVIEY